MSHVGKRAASVLAALATSACSLALDWDGLSPDIVQPSGPCVGAPGPAMVQIESYCIDSTEVTKAHYQAFLDAQPDVAAQLPECELNMTFEPSDWPLISEEASHPVGYVDWCDAFAYCAWAGKALCGRLEGGAAPAEEAHNPEVSQWYRACTRNGTRDYPYGGAYLPICNAGPGVPEEVAPVGSYPECVGGYDGLLDMVGNVAEWEDTCSPTIVGSEGLVDPCSIRGDDYDQMGSASCAETLGVERMTRADYIGFRCCALLF